MSHSVDQLVLIGLIQLSLVLLAMLGVRIGGATSLLLIAQAVFWTLGFVLRPLFLTIVQPSDPSLLADIRLALAGYGEPMTRVLALVLLGTTSYVLTIYVLHSVVRARRRRIGVEQAALRAGALSETGRKSLVVAGLALWGVGWLGRASTLGGVGGLVVQLAPMAVTGSVLLILGLKRGRHHNIGVGLVVAVEILWSMSFESKAALILPVMALCLRFILQARKAELLRALPLLAGGVLVGFFVIQSTRGILTGADVAEISAAVGGGAAVGYIVGLLQRFDGFSSVTDAVYLDGSAWQTTEQYFARLGQNLVPKFGVEQLGSNGQLWTREVRAYSIRNQFLDVPIAAGPTAEGYAMWGWAGVVVLNVLMAAIVLILGRLLMSSSALAVIFAVSMSFNTGFFEIGLQGWAGSFNKSVQALVVAIPVVLLVKLLHRSPTKTVPHTPGSEYTTVVDMEPHVRRAGAGE